MVNIIIGAAAFAVASVVGYATQRKNNKEVVKTFLDNSGKNTATKITNAYVKKIVDSSEDTELKSKQLKSYTTDDINKLRNIVANNTNVCNGGNKPKDKSAVDSIDPDGKIKEAIDKAINNIISGANDMAREASEMLNDVADTIAKNSGDIADKVKGDIKADSNKQTPKSNKQKMGKDKGKKPKQQEAGQISEDDVILSDSNPSAMGKLGDILGDDTPGM